MISSQDELEKFYDRKATLFAEAFRNLAEARLKGGDYTYEIEEVAKLLKHTMILSNLYGRKRILMEADSISRRSSFDAVPDKTPLSSMVFEEAIEDLVSREPRLVASSEELARLYTNEHVFGMARSIDLNLTKRVQQALADLASGGKGFPEAERVLAEITPFTRHYAATVYRTNLSSNYNAGRFQQARDPDISRVIPAMEYQSLHDARTRPNHKAADGLIAATDDPIWSRFRPPLGHQCRCATEFVSIFELERKGLVRNGHVMRYIPPSFANAHPDEGFKVGQMGWEAA